MRGRWTCNVSVVSIASRSSGSCHVTRSLRRFALAIASARTMVLALKLALRFYYRCARRSLL
jgi:hypothetical protein